MTGKPGRKVVSVFGAGAPALGSPTSGSPVYEDSRRLGALLAEAGFAVATGGYAGVMEAVSRGAREADGHVIGVTCDRIETYRSAKANQWVQEEVRFPLLRERMYHLITVADAMIAMPGGVGTLGEVAAAWNGMQTGEIAAKPLVLVGDGWRATFDVFLEHMNGLVEPADIALLTFCQSPEDAVAAVRQALR